MGQDFVKMLRPAGAVFVLILAIIATVFMFTARGGQVEGYTPPEDSEYYAAHPEELAEELTTNLLPKLNVGDVTVELRDGKLLVTAPEKTMNSVKLTLTYYYDKELFEFQTK